MTWDCLLISHDAKVKKDHRFARSAADVNQVIRLISGMSFLLSLRMGARILFLMIWVV